MIKITINKKDIEQENVSHLASYQVGWSPFELMWDQPAGVTEFKLYSYLANKFENTNILDVGTLFGGSALAFSNSNNHVISYDIVHLVTHDNLKKDNIELRIGNFMEDDIDYSKIDLILIDVDPHDGLQEPPMIDYLINIGWKGLLLLDDIMYQAYPVMQKMWYDLPYEKYDMTPVGHFSGTGLLNIGNKFELEFIAE